jgi:signal transduction histidine kinase/HPt (histidine-containing phosphotransfer) domain-containing protein
VDYEVTRDALAPSRAPGTFEAVDAAVQGLARETEDLLTGLETGDLESVTRRMAGRDSHSAAAYEQLDQLAAARAADRSATEAAIVADGARLVDLGWGLGVGVAAASLLVLLGSVRHLADRGRARSEREQLVADLERARADAEAANRAKSEFLANMSHEIRTPMTAILGYADLLLEPGQGPSDRLENIQTIRRNGGHLLTLVNDILDLSKIEAGKMDIEELACDPGAIVAEVASLMQVRAAEKGVRFEVVYADPLPTRIVTDPTRLRQILLNLVGNALKFTERGSVKLVGHCRAEGQRLEFDVIDSGAGMSPETMSRLFRPFTQADSSTTRVFGGTGLGLTISRRLARMLGGDISVRSQLGEGSTFSVHVTTGPLEDVPRAVAPTFRVVDAQRPGLPRVTGSILLAEDGPDNQRLIVAILRIAGAEVEVVDNGRTAAERALERRAEGRPFDLILMDMQMPVLDGYGATSYLRSQGYTGPIVALTAHAMAGDRDKCLTAGCDGHETKPVDRSALLGTVARYLRADVPAATPPPPPLALVPLASTYSGDPDMEPLIRDFVDELPVRLEEMEQALDRGDRDRIRRVAHQLRGAGGAYGFASVTDCCKTLEEAAGRADDLGPPLEALAALVRRITLARAA